MTFSTPRAAIALLTLALGSMTIHAQDKVPDAPVGPGADFSRGSFFGKPSVMRVVFPEDPIQWHPHYYYNALEAQLLTGVYEGLVVNHPVTQRPSPGIAESWTLSNDKLTYTFLLRDNARFSNGDLLTAQDFVDSWLALLDLGSTAPFATMLDPIKGVKAWRQGPSPATRAAIGLRAPDARTLEVRLESPAAYFLQILAHQSLVPIHPEQRGPWKAGTIPLGNGPFILAEQGTKRIILDRNPLYWEADEVALDRIEVIMSDDARTNTQGYNQGSYQWVLGNVSYGEIQNRDAIVLTPQFATNFLFFNQSAPAFQDSRVRTALGLLVDMDKLRDPEYYYITADRLVPNIPYYPDIRPFPRSNRDKALSLLADAGFPRGKGLPEIRIVLPEGEGSKRIADILTAAWKDLETRTVYEPWVGPDYNERLQAQEVDYTVGTLGWIGDYADPLSFLDLFAATSNLNLGRYQGKPYNELLVKAAAAEGAERYRILAEAESILIQEVVCIPLSHSPAINIVDKEEVEGWYENPFDLHPFKYLRPRTPRPPRNIALLD